MEGLIKGFADVAIGGDRHCGDDEGNSRDERSRSTWAEVVSGDQEIDDDRVGRSRGRYHNQAEQKHDDDRYSRSGDNQRHDYEQHQWKRQEDDQESNQGWETDGRKPSRGQPHKEVQEENNDGWETVGRRKPVRLPRKVLQDHWHEYKLPASEQLYSEHVEIDGRIEPSGEELSDLSQACNKLWELDLNRLVPGRDYQIDCGEGKKVYQKQDMAEGTLFSWVSEKVFRKPTFARFCSLLDNYNPNEGYKEVVTAEEKQEQAAFIEEISRTAPIKYLHKCLSNKRVVPENYQEFKRELTSLWFDLYGRGGTSGSSSAFEHVFVGEIKQQGEQQVSGFHNWLQFYLEEAKGNVDYQGYILPRRRGEIPDSETQLLTIQFEWNGVPKSVSSTLVGASPEFEVALYTLCFFVGNEENHIQLGPYNVNVKCYRLGHKMGSAFPIAES